MNPERKRRASRRQNLPPGKSARPHPTRPARSRGHAGRLVIPAFLILYGTAALAWSVPAWVGWLYLVASLVCFAVYAADKSAAVTGRWRVSERTLLLLGLVGGWPGAIVAQQALRHKSSKPAFLTAFWGATALNIVVFIVLFTPLLTGLRP